MHVYARHALAMHSNAMQSHAMHFHTVLCIATVSVLHAETLRVSSFLLNASLTRVTNPAFFTFYRNAN